MERSEGSDCSLWIMVARTDMPFMMHTIPHLVRTCRHPFQERVLAVDTAPLSGDKVRRPGVGSLEELRLNCQKLLQNGYVDRVIDMDYSDTYRRKVYKKHFGTSRLEQTHNYKGYPILGSIFCLEECRSRYLLHFDSDMLHYQAPHYDWIQDGIRLMQNEAGVLWVRPQAGPQSSPSELYECCYSLKRRADDHFELSGFASRLFLIDRERLREILPLPILWARRQGRLQDELPPFLMRWWRQLSLRGRLDSWEEMMRVSAETNGLKRIDLANNKTWTLHPNLRGDAFFRLLPRIIEKVEKGEFPKEQLGKYDLDLPAWQKFLAS